MIIEARGLARTFRSRKRSVEAVRGVDLTVKAGDAMRDVFAGHYVNSVVAEGIAVSVGLAAVCLWLAGRAFAKENA